MVLQKTRRAGSVLLLLGLAPGAGCAWAAAQEPPAEGAQTEAAAPRKWDYRFGLEVRANYRHSEENRFQVPFPFPPSFLPVGQAHGFEETVNAGTHYEFSDVTVSADAGWGDVFTTHLKVDLIDLYDRNPTSTGKNVDIDEAWIRVGRETETATLASRSGAYFKLGKIGKFERQEDRHLQSYGLVSTAFNRFEETGAEVGADLGRHFYVKVRGASGNPVFLRDPNALAGDNGTAVLLQPNPDPRLKTGIDILYNAHEANFDVDGKLETGVGIGWRIADEGGRNGLDVLAWGNERQLARRASIHGTFYGGDIDILNGPEVGLPTSEITYPITNDRKREDGGNVWLYLGGFSFFGQYVDQDLAGLKRTGLEGEVAWHFNLPLFWAIHGRQVFTSIAPAVRYSKLNDGFNNPMFTPSPSFAWDWRKIDYGVRLGLYNGLDLTVEYSDNRFIRAAGPGTNNETLVTLGLKL